MEKITARKLPEKLDRKPVLFKELVADAIDHASAMNGESAQKNLATITTLLLPVFGNRQAEGIDTTEFKKWCQKEKAARGWSNGTHDGYVTQIKHMYTLGRENKKLIGNPTEFLKRIAKGSNDKIRYLTPDEESRMEKTILKDWPQHWDAYQFARNTGIRAGSQLSPDYGLRWKQIEMGNKIMTLPKVAKSKIKKDWRLPLNDIAFPIIQKRWSPSVKPNDFVFAEYHDGPDYLWKPAHWFPEIVEAAGLEDFTWHSLRHDFASQLIMQGANLKDVQLLMCHTSIKQTAKYADLAPDHLADAANRLTRPRVTSTETATAPDRTESQNRTASRTATSTFGG